MLSHLDANADQSKSSRIYTPNSFSVRELLLDIERGEIGLPRYQRPFLWDDNNVYELFDSLYKGYPVGYLLLWDDGQSQHSRSIGSETPGVRPRRLVIDGQQRLSSLYSVIGGRKVVDTDYSEKEIKISFNPLQGTFATPLEAETLENSAEYVSDITPIFDPYIATGEHLARFVEQLRLARRELSEVEERTVLWHLDKLRSLPDAVSFETMVIRNDNDETDIAEIFSRINKTGIKLTDEDLAVTRLSTLWPEGHAKLLDFCKNAHIAGESVFNNIVKPLPTDLIGVVMRKAFRCASSEYLERMGVGTDNEQRIKDAQFQALDAREWMRYIDCIRSAGFVDERMIRDDDGNINSLVFPLYALYLIGTFDYKIPYEHLRPKIAEVFFVSEFLTAFMHETESLNLTVDLVQILGSDQLVNQLEYPDAKGDIDEPLSCMDDLVIKYLRFDENGEPTYLGSWLDDKVHEKDSTSKMDVFIAAQLLMAEDAPSLFSRYTVAELIEQSTDSLQPSLNIFTGHGQVTSRT